MKVAFNARTLSAPQLRGWSRYASNLIRELSHMNIEIYLLSDRPLNESLLKDCSKKNLKVIVKKGFLYIDWEQRVLPQLCDELEIDILHCPINYGLPFKRNWKQVLTLHDAIEKAYYDQFKSFFEKISLDHLYVRSLHKLSQLWSDQIITVSEHAKKDIVKYYSVPEEKLTVIYEAADPIFHSKAFDRSRLSDKFNIDEDYLFYVGGFEKRKNLGFLLQSMAYLKEKPFLVIAGGGSEIDSYRKLCAELGLSQRVKFTGWVDDEDLPTLYHYAKALVYPSFYEGFGLQVVEAIAVGCPVLCSNKTSLPEIWGMEESTFDPTDIESLATLIERLNKDSQFYENLKLWAQQRSRDFNWKKTAEKTMDLYSRILLS